MNAISENIVTFLFNAMIQITVVACIALLCSVAQRRVAAKHRYTLWVAALLLGSVIPLWSLRASLFRIVGGHGAQSMRDGHQFRAIAGGDGNIDPSVWMRLSTPREEPIPFPPMLGVAIAGCYALFLTYRSARLWAAWRRTRKLYRLAAGVPPLRALRSLIDRHAKDFGLRLPPQTYALDGVGPLTLGAKRPILLLPKTFVETASADELDATICHEFAHVARKDFAVNLLCEFATLPVYFHPLVWWMKSQVRHARELACDDLAAERSSTPARYASALVHVAQSLLGNPATIQPELAQGLFDTENIESRVSSLLDRKNLFGNTAGRAITLATLCCLVGVTLMTSALSLQLASSQPIAAAAPVAAQSTHAENPARPRVRVSTMSFVESTPSIDEAEIQSFAKQIEGMKTLNQSMDWAEEVQERTRNFWQEHGYFKVKVEDASTLVSDSPNGQVFSVLAAVTPGTQYRLKKLVFDEAKGITTQELATMFPISPGDIFDVQKIRTGFENLRRAYPASYKDWLFAPYTEINDSDHTIVLRMRLHGDEELSGK